MGKTWKKNKNKYYDDYGEFDKKQEKMNRRVSTRKNFDSLDEEDEWSPPKRKG